MKVGAKIYKSLVFTLMRDKILSGEKTSTGRTTFIPPYEIGEIIAIVFKEEKKKELLFLAEVTDLYPKQIKDFTLKEARRDGFDSIKAFQKTIMELNNIKSKNHWCFITGFKRIKDMSEWTQLERM